MPFKTKDKLTTRVDQLLGRIRTGDQSAEADLEKLAAKKPKHPVILNALGCLSLERGKGDDALDYLQKALKSGYKKVREVKRNLIIASAMIGDQEGVKKYWHENQGLVEPIQSALRAAKIFKHYETMRLCLDLWEEMTPDDPKLILNQAALAFVMYDEKNAKDILERLPEPESDDFALNILATELLVQAKLPLATAYFQKAYDTLDKSKPNDVQRMASSATNLKQWDAASKLLEELVQDFPHLAESKLFTRLDIYQQSCQWEKVEELVPKYIDAVEQGRYKPSSLFRALSFPGLSDKEHLMLAKAYISRFEPSKEDVPSSVFERPPRAGRKLRIGYLTADFKNHPVTQLLVETIELHDRDRFEVLAYDITPSGAEGFWRDRILSAFDQVVPARAMKDEELAAKIREDKIDVLIDLQGDTSFSRCWILRHRLAPVQAGWLGFPGTTGGISDYIIADPHIIPEEAFPYYAEKVVQLPDTYIPNDAQRTPMPPPPRFLENLPEDALVFACFNQHYKITREMFEAWCTIMNQVPGSLLWLRDGESSIKKRLCQEAQNRGIAPERLIFAARKPQHSEHLARLQCADISLDTRPYNSHTICVDSLYAGVPLVTLPGNSFASRVAKGILHVSGLPELVADDIDKFISIALDLANNQERRKNLRQKLIQARQSSPLFDSRRFAANLEAAFEAMYERFEQGLAPDHIRVQSNGQVRETTSGTKPSLHVLLEQGEYWLNQEKLSKALPLYTDALELDPQNPRAMQGLGIIYGLAGQYDKSLPLLEKSVELDPNKEWYADNLEKMKEKAGQNSVQRLSELINQGAVFHKQKNYDQAIACYEQVLNTSPSHPVALHYKGLAMIKNGDGDEGLKLLRRSIEIQPHNQVFLDNYRKASRIIEQPIEF
ncbi:tetratricopeptide repeat protein [Desulfonatronovibrio magnus]|uniref:O-linked N-acetylglucosamine transferase family protein n=1 Tax=Desulfonatronovibrio magnus TaxID=698827 RepID=UPI000696E814|nr:tetratricopeptide repeat protein [Desulfonatronovibrio magnus]